MTQEAAIDPQELRRALGAFVTGVTVLTTQDADGGLYGVTANSFNSVSLDPPLVLWSQARTSRSFQAFQSSQGFAVNILAADQAALAQHFARSASDKFRDVAHSRGLGGVPVLDGAAAVLECTTVACHPGGDHVIYIGEVKRIARTERPALAFSGGQFMVASPLDERVVAA